MRKWIFWLTMCLVSLLNGVCFFLGSLAAMGRGVEGVDNQAGLLFIPVLWILAGMVLLGLNACTFVYGTRIQPGCRIHLREIFRFAALKAGERVGRGAFLAATGLLMLFGYALFASDSVIAAAYALSGGLLLLCLYTWQKAGVSCC